MQSKLMNLEIIRNSTGLVVLREMGKVTKNPPVELQQGNLGVYIRNIRKGFQKIKDWVACYRTKISRE